MSALYGSTEDFVDLTLINSQPSPFKQKRAESFAENSELVQLVLRCAGVPEFFLASAVNRLWKSCVDEMIDKEQWYHWSRKELTTRTKSKLLRETEHCWRAAFVRIESGNVLLSDSEPDSESDSESDAPPSPPKQYRACIKAATQYVQSTFKKKGVTFTIPQLLQVVETFLGQPVCESMQQLLSQPGWQFATSVWAVLFVVLGLYSHMKNIHLMVEHLWGVAQKPPPLLPPHQLRELLCSVLVLMRHEQWRKDSKSGMAGHNAIFTELMSLDELDARRAWSNSDLPVPSRHVDIGVPLTSEQVHLIQTAVPFTPNPRTGRLAYPRPLPNVAHKVVALAGSGKTTMLRAFALAHPDLNFLYTCYNREAREHAEKVFPLGNVTCSTTHALAGRTREWLYRRKKAGGKSAKYLGMPTTVQLCNLITQRLNREKNAPYSVVGYVKTILENFLTTIDEEITEAHFPPAKKRPNLRDHPDYIDLATHIYKKMVDPNDDMAAPHNAYLKLFAMEKPKLVSNRSGKWYDCVLVDEAQDLNPMTRDLLMSQPCTKIFVGDPHQHIYSFNHCCNALKDQEPFHRSYQLRTTFRMGPEIGHIANRVLTSALGATKPLIAVGPPFSVVYLPTPAQDPDASQSNLDSDSDDPISQSQQSSDSQQSFRFNLSQNPNSNIKFVLTRFRSLDSDPGPWPAEIPTCDGIAMLPINPQTQQRPMLALICRTNAAALLWAARLATRGTQFATSLELDNILKKVHQLDLLKRTNRGTGALWQYKSYADFLDALENGLDADWKAAKQFLELSGNNIEDLARTIANMADTNPLARECYEYYITTAHKVKGQEFQYVQLCDDFAQELTRDTNPNPAAAGPDVAQEDDEFNLVYVAATRAKHVLFANQSISKLLEGQFGLTVHARDLGKLEACIGNSNAFAVVPGMQALMAREFGQKGRMLHPGSLMQNAMALHHLIVIAQQGPGVAAGTEGSHVDLPLLCGGCLRMHHVREDQVVDACYGEAVLCKNCVGRTWLSNVVG